MRVLIFDGDSTITNPLIVCFIVKNLTYSIEETPIMLIATHTPVPKKNNNIDIKKIIKSNSGMTIFFYFLKLKI